MYSSSELIHKLDKPILCKEMVPYKTALTFNAGTVKYNGKYVTVFRNDYGDFENRKLEGTNLGLAYSDDGINWTVTDKPCFALADDEIKRVYDPRLTVIDGTVYMCFAVDTRHGVRGGIAKTEDFENFDVLSMSVPDDRNMVLFPEKIGGNFVRLERPMPVYSRGGHDRFDIWLSESPDMIYWGKTRLVMGVENVPYANDKIGPGCPPVKTDKGWLAMFHAVERDETRGKHGWENSWKKMYYAGAMLLDLEDPSKVIGISKDPLIVAELPFENEGCFREDVIFPTGMILEDSGELKLYYSASDTVHCLATADVNDIIGLCLDK